MADHDFTVPGLSKDIVEEASLQRLEPLASSLADELGVHEPEFTVLCVGLAKAFNEGVDFASSEILAQMHEAGMTLRFRRPRVPPSEEGESGT